jgi:hypothetical protein
MTDKTAKRDPPLQNERPHDDAQQALDAALRRLGAEILQEPVPEKLLRALDGAQGQPSRRADPAAQDVAENPLCK